LRIDVEHGCGWLNQNPNSPENTPKNAKKAQLIENQKDNETTFLLHGCPVFKFSLQERRFSPFPPIVTPLDKTLS